MARKASRKDITPLITVFDTAVCSLNLGDTIIMRSVAAELRRLFPDAYLVTVPTHDSIGDEGLKAVRRSRFAFVGGTNLLSSNMWSYNQWKIGPRQAFHLRNVVLLGVGWWQYQQKAGPYTKWLLRRVLHADLQHSLRDDYTRRQLGLAGLGNGLNTGCVTLWTLDEAHTRAIPSGKAASVVCTLTDYKPEPAADRQMLATLLSRYEQVFLWLQGAEDLCYVREMVTDNVVVVPPDLDAFDHVLTQMPDIEYVGTRLHAGIRAMQLKRRATIIAVDNRATEMGGDFGLPILPREEIAALPAMLDAERPTRIRLPKEAIAAWRSQFAAVAAVPPGAAE